MYFYQPSQGHGLPHDPLNAIIGPRPIGWISSCDQDGQLNLARQALCLQAGESLGGVDDDIRFGRAESGSAKQDQGEAEVTKQHAAILPDSPLTWPSLAASFADCLAALAKNARQKPGPVVWHGACF
mgnify:CR=1 FL=1